MTLELIDSVVYQTCFCTVWESALVYCCVYIDDQDSRCTLVDCKTLVITGSQLTIVLFVLSLVLRCPALSVALSLGHGLLMNIIFSDEHIWWFLCPTADLHSLLDMAKVADSLVFVLDTTEGWDSYGDYCLSCLFAQGLPSHGESKTFTLSLFIKLIVQVTDFSTGLWSRFAPAFKIIALVCQGVTDLPVKKRVDARRALSKITENRFPDARLFPLDSEQDGTLLLRHLGSQRQRKLGFRSRRPHLLAQHVTFTPNSEAASGLGTLCVSGYVRGRPLRANRLVHISGHGDFQLSQIDAPADPLPLNVTARQAKRGKGGDSDMMVGDVKTCSSTVLIKKRSYT